VAVEIEKIEEGSAAHKIKKKTWTVAVEIEKIEEGSAAHKITKGISWDSVTYFENGKNVLQCSRVLLAAFQENLFKIHGLHWKSHLLSNADLIGVLTN